MPHIDMTHFGSWECYSSEEIASPEEWLEDLYKQIEEYAEEFQIDNPNNNFVQQVVDVILERAKEING